MKRLWTLLLAVLLLAAGGLPEARSLAGETEMQIGVSGSPLLPGEAVILALTVPEDGVCSIDLVDGRGEILARVAEDRPVTAGYNALYWNGTWRGMPVPEGDWKLRLSMNGRTAETGITVGRMTPTLLSVSADRDTVPAGRKITVNYWATGEGTLIAKTGETVLLETRVKTGAGEAAFEAALPPGYYPVEVALRREDGTQSPSTVISVTTTEPAEAYTPIGRGCGEEWALNAWTVPMDITDEEAVWQALTAPVTVLEDGKDKAQVRQLVLRKDPDPQSEGIGTVTLASQGVHVLERGETWSRIECYSSSFHDSPILNWNVLVQGWVETRLLKTIVPDQEMGLVIDKLTQRMYVFQNGKLFSTLLVSTGLASPKQPYNETRSGEFLLVSRVGGFYSDNMYCPRAIRFNDGDLLHEVPYVERNGKEIYSVTEPNLGSRASHGCIRVQRKVNPEGLNQEWLYSHYRQNTKILIWEDWRGRQIEIPEDDTVFWRNPAKEDYYHCSEHCQALNTKKPAEIRYAELSAEGSGWKACPYCGPIQTREKLLEINRLYAEGGDHDPVLTEARKDCPKKGR